MKQLEQPILIVATVLTALLVSGTPTARAVEAPAAAGTSWTLKTNVQVTSVGVYLSDVVVPPTNMELPHLRVADAPLFGRAAVLNPGALNPLLKQALQLDPGTNWIGAPQVTITRRARTLTSLDIEELLTEKLSSDYLSQGGQLELRLTRTWNDVAVPDEPFEVKIVSMPAQGIMPSFIVRFEIGNQVEKFGQWQLALRASLWKDVWVARQRLTRGNVLMPEDVAREKRDVLMARNHLEADQHEIKPNDWELTENVGNGAPLNRWSVRPKPVVYRGQLADAQIRQGALSISLKVQVLEDAVPGQEIRILNPNTKRELLGKVNHDQTILIQL
ncbi:MAG TPA: flagella basal body P-ring formation protein FlgA [Verrucomicrobiales bacterium]|nr:flagella basal body P-ring formation protein FlgA [Verrucomicrobiales bacterium]